MGQIEIENLLSYRMTTTHSCGPDAVAFVLGANKERNQEKYDNILKLMKWPNKCDWRDNARDYVGSHFRLLDALGIEHRLIKVSDILSGKFIPGRVVALLHNYLGEKEVDSWLLERRDEVFYQHWVVVDHVGKIEAIIHDGRGKARSVSVADLKYWLTCGPSPACAYVVGEGRLGGYYLERCWDVFASFVVRAYTWIVGK